MKLVCIDFETANRFIGSICAVGVAVIEQGHISQSRYWLVKPHVAHNIFDPFNIMIHGIQPRDVQDALEFNAIYDELRPLLSDSILVAHNAAFDMSALRHVLDLYNIEYPTVDYLCTYKLSRRVWSGLENYKLDTVSRSVGHQFNHHNAQEDALACGKVLLAALAAKGVSDINEITSLIGMKMGSLYSQGYSPCSIRNSKKTLQSVLPIGIGRCSEQGTDNIVEETQKDLLRLLK